VTTLPTHQDILT